MEQMCTLLYNDWVPSEHNTRPSKFEHVLSEYCVFFSMWTVIEAAIHLIENGGNIIFIFVLINPLCLDCVCRILSNCETRY